MSAIEEAREQAREALEQQTRAVLEGYGMSAIAVNLRDALRALLDATEPPAPLSIEDFITGTTDGEVDTDEFFADLDERPAEPMRDADGDMISSGVHRKVSMSGDSFFVCDTCTNVLGLNVRWDHASKREDHQAAVESLLDKPAEDEREALANVLLDGRDADEGLSALRDRILAAGYRKGPRQITDEMVLAGLNAHDERNPGRALKDWTDASVRRMRLTLEAAEGARR